MEGRYKRHFQTLILVTIVWLGSVALLNVLVDPIGAYPKWHLRRFEPWRYLQDTRVAKAEMARRGDWEVVILGSSRAKAGLPCDHPFLATNRTCNLSLDGVGFPELMEVFHFARRHNSLKHVLLCLDFYMFSKGKTFRMDFRESRFHGVRNPVEYHSKRLLSRGAVGDSWDAVEDWFKDKVPPDQDQYGFFAHELREKTSQRELFDIVMRQLGPSHGRQTTDPAAVDLFRTMARECRDGGIDLQVVIMPVHALDLELLYVGGRWPAFEQWKTDLVAILDEEGMEDRTRLLDFTGYSGPLAEPVPPLNTPKARMTYFYENSHCTPFFGRLILEAVYGPDAANLVGTALTRGNIQAHLERIREDRMEYVAAHPREARWVQEIMADATPSTQSDVERVE